MLAVMFVVADVAPAYSCALGFSFNFSPLPPGAIALNAGDSVASFMNRKFGRQGWQRASEADKAGASGWQPLQFKALSIIENSAVIPLTFGSRAPELAGKIARVELYQFRTAPVVEFPREAGAQATAIEKMFPGRSPIAGDSPLGPMRSKLMALKLMAMETRLSATFHLNTKADAPLAIPLISTRVRAPRNSRWFQAAAIFFPADKSQRPLVAATKRLALHGCKFSYFVKGAWPKNLRRSYGYE